MNRPRALEPPYPPMEALLVKEIPTGEDWQYEPKWDGFRCLVFRRGEKVELQSKSGRPLTRYFPDVVEAMLALRSSRFVLDGEIIVWVDGQPSFDDLLQRIHPAESRVKRLATATPANFVAFDLLEDEAGAVLTHLPLIGRRKKLEALARKNFKKGGRIELSQATRELSVARRWFASRNIGFDGIVAKRLDMDYRSGERTGMQKIKRMRTADCVVAGFRYASKGKTIGSLLLGLYDKAGLLHHVGFTSAFKAADRPALTRQMERLKKPVAKGGGFSGRSPGGPSRFSTERSGEWEPLDPELVVEVHWDHFTGGRFRHGTKLLRFRPEKSPRQCTMDQIPEARDSVIPQRAGRSELGPGRVR